MRRAFSVYSLSLTMRVNIQGQGELVNGYNRRFWSAALAAILIGVLAGCKGGGASDNTTTDATGNASNATSARPVPPGEGVSASGDTIKIGLVASMTGDNKPWGEDSYEGAKIAVEE